jgi:hypothetical protein
MSEAAGKVLVYLRKSNLESLFNIRQYSTISLAADKGNTQALGSETTSTSNTMEVLVCVLGHIIVDGEIDPLDINTSTKHIRGNADTLVEFFEFLVAFDTRADIRSRLEDESAKRTYRSS